MIRLCHFEATYVRGSSTCRITESDARSQSGIVRGIAGGESGIIVQDTIVRRMIYLPGDPRVFQIEKIAEKKAKADKNAVTNFGIDASNQHRHIQVGNRNFSEKNLIKFKKNKKNKHFFFQNS